MSTHYGTVIVLGTRDIEKDKVYIENLLVFHCSYNECPQAWWLNTTKMYYITILKISKVVLSKLKSGYIIRAAFLRSSRGKSVFIMLFPASGGCLHSLDHDPNHSELYFLYYISFSDSDSPLLVVTIIQREMMGVGAWRQVEAV